MTSWPSPRMLPMKTMPSTPPDILEVATGHDEPIRLPRSRVRLEAECFGPTGVQDAEAVDRTTAAITQPVDAPPLRDHLVGGDRIVVAVADGVVQTQQVLETIVSTLSAAGATAEQIEVLRLWSRRLEPVVPGATTTIFDPGNEADLSYLMADAEANPRHVARGLVDADVIVTVGSFTWNAALGGRATEGEIWPAFSRRAASEDLMQTLALRPRGGHRAWQAAAEEVLWQLGVIAELKVVPGRDGSLAHVAFGMPQSVLPAVRKAASAWTPRIARAAEVTLASLSDPHAGLDRVARAIAAAARVTYPDGTVCIASRLREEPGVVFARWRQGVAIEPLVKEAVRSRDPALISDAFITRQVARALGSRRLVLASDLEEAAVESLDIGHAATADDVIRLCTAAESVIVLHEADRMLPRLRS
jgi:hypothetical protein